MANINTKIILANDLSAKWKDSERQLKKGEVAVSYNGDGTAELRFGSLTGDKAYSESVKLQISADQVVGLNETITSLSTTHYETDDINKLSDDYVNGDTAVEIKTIADDKKSYTAYVYDTTVGDWKAMDGNYRADNVYFDEDITLAGEYTQVGNITKGKTATTTLSASGKSLEDVMKSIFTKKLQPTKSDPAVTVTLTNAGEYEVGESVSTGYTASCSTGSYTYGPSPTGVTVESWEVTDSAGSTAKTTSTGSFDNITVGDSTNYTVTAKATYSAGSVAKDNLGDASSPTVQIAAGNKSKTSSAITGYRMSFWGAVAATATQLDIDTLTSGQVRTLGNNSKDLPTAFTAPAGTKQIVFAAKAGKYSSLTATDGNALNATVTFKKKANAVDVEGKDNYEATKYDIWYCILDAAVGAAKDMALTLVWA